MKVNKNFETNNKISRDTVEEIQIITIQAEEKWFQVEVWGYRQGLRANRRVNIQAYLKAYL